MEKYRDRLLRAHRAGLGDLDFLAEVDAVLDAVAEGESDAPIPLSQPCPKGTLAEVDAVLEEIADAREVPLSQPPDIGGDVPGGGAV